MSFSPEIQAFIKSFANDIASDNAAIFSGAGMSKTAGYVDWRELLTDIAAELGLKIELESDLISLAQFHVNENKTSSKLSRKILEEFSEQAEPTETHAILARLPIRTFWTTNYDSLIEDSLKRAFKIADVKHSIEQLNTTRPKRDAVVYKMHGDVTLPSKAVLYKEQYEIYYKTHEPFVTALSGDLAAKTFLFIGFSFNDPNLDYILSRLHTSVRKNHYCFVRREALSAENDEEIRRYKLRKQELRIDDLKRFGIQALLINSYDEIPQILKAVESRFLKKTVFISGSAEVFGDWSRQEAQEFIHSLSAELVKNNFRIVNGFGWGIGSAVINGALDAIYNNPDKYSEDQLVIRPFPQFATSAQELPVLWEEYRRRMISLAGIAVFIFGNKPDREGNIVIANGVIREFEIAIEGGRVPIPIGITGYAAKQIWDQISSNLDKYYSGVEWVAPLVSEISDPTMEKGMVVKKIIDLLQRLNK